MLRLRLILFAAAIAILLAAAVFIGCTKERVTDPDTHSAPTHHALFTSGMSVRADTNAYQIYVQTSAELDTALDQTYGLNLVDGDTLLLKAGVTFQLGSKTYPQYNDISLHIIGEWELTRFRGYPVKDFSFSARTLPG